jgi:hypothetical protein
MKIKQIKDVDNIYSYFPNKNVDGDEEENKRNSQASKIINGCFYELLYIKNTFADQKFKILPHQTVCEKLSVEKTIYGITMRVVEWGLFYIFRLCYQPVEVNRTEQHNNYGRPCFKRDKTNLSNQFVIFDQLLEGARKYRYSNNDPYINILVVYNNFDIVPHDNLDGRKDFFSSLLPDWIPQDEIKSFAPTRDKKFATFIRGKLKDIYGFDVVKELNIDIESLRSSAMKGGFPKIDIITVHKQDLQCLDSFQKFLRASGFFHNEERYSEFVNFYNTLYRCSHDPYYNDIENKHFNYFIFCPEWYGVETENDQILFLFDLSLCKNLIRKRNYKFKDMEDYYKRFGGVPLDETDVQRLKIYEYFFHERCLRYYNKICCSEKHFFALETELQSFLVEKEISRDDARNMHEQHYHHFIIKNSQCSSFDLGINPDQLALCLPLTKAGHMKNIVNGYMSPYEMMGEYFFHGIMDKEDLNMAIDYLIFVTKKDKVLEKIRTYIDKIDSGLYASKNDYKSYRKVDYAKAFSYS